jgi:hypothetical protein
MTPGLIGFLSFDGDFGVLRQECVTIFRQSGGDIPLESLK